MKWKIVLLFVMLIAMLAVSGCWRYGTGTSTGYVYAVDGGVFWNQVWFKPSLASTESDCYIIGDDVLSDRLAHLPANTQIKIHYSRHISTLSGCPEKSDTNDEITSFEIV